MSLNADPPPCPGPLGILGGTFDPPHHGHLALARSVGERLGLERVWLIPAAWPPHKPPYAITPFPLRAAMIQAAIEGDPRLGVSLIEQDTNGPSFSIDTLERLAASEAKGRRLYFIIGSDAFADLPSWHRFAELPRLASLVVVSRIGQARQARIDELMRRHFPEFAPAADGRWQAAGKNDLLHLNLPVAGISSTEVRDLARRGEDLSGLVPAPVAELIARRRLYTGQADP